jgi:hypothetical protein
VSRSRELLSTLMSAQAGGFLAQPPGLDGDLGLGIPGVSGQPRGRTWDAVAAARAPELTGDTVMFVALADGTLIVNEDVPDGSLAPLADAIEETISPPYRAAAVRNEGDVWSAIADRIAVVELPGLDGEVVELSVVGGVRELSVDDEQATQAVPALDALAGEHGDVSLHAERVDGDLFAVDVFPL